MKKLLFLLILLSLTFNLYAQEIIADLVITDKDGKTVQSDIGLAVLNEELRETLKTTDTGTGPGDILKLDSSSKIPAVNGSQLTGFTQTQIPTLTTAGKVDTSALTGTTYLPDATVDTTALKTATGEVSGSTGHYTLPGGTYGFYPQFKVSAGNYRAQFVDLDTNTSYVTDLYLEAGGTAYAQQRYVTASGEDMWIFLLIDKTTKEIIGAYQANDAPHYGNGGDFDKLPHPFGSYDETKHDIILLDKETCNQLKQKSKQTGKSILTLVNEDYKVNMGKELEYQPLHSGRYIDDDTGKQIKELVKNIPNYIKVRKLIAKEKR